MTSLPESWRAQFPPPARLAAPLLVLVFGLAILFLNYRWNLADDLARGSNALRAEADATGARLTRLGGQLRSPVGIAALQADLAVSAEAPDLALAAFVDPNGWVLASSSSELSGREARLTLLQAAASLIQSPGAKRVMNSENGERLYAAYPTMDANSWVLLVYDRSARMAQARSDASRSLRWSALATGGLGLALWAVLHYGFARRIAKLAQMAREFGAGERKPLSPLPGGDEVAELSRDLGAMAADVIAHEERRTQMEKQILEAGEAERRRVGHELHDGLGQHLTAAALAADGLAAALEHDPQDSVRAHEVAAQIREAIAETRRLSHGLAPVGLESGGLALALENMAAGLNTGGGVRVVFETGEPPPTCLTEIATHLFRIAQEAVNNALKHATPGEIRIGFHLDGEMLALEVEDDGEGISERLSGEPGMGLRVMRHRAQLLGGTLQLTSAPAGGTLLRCVVPLPT